ncbi:MAG TPA: ATP-binding protein [Planctomycetaceae bacterium]|jgi:signal transduction histidine kinase|nr:ATP-binding protein [Planctomycetaceae bacterium]
MKLTTKLVAALVCGTILVLGIETYFSVRDDVQTFRQDLRRDASQRARSLAGLIQDVWKVSGERRALQLIDDANAEGPSGVRWVWLDAQPGEPRAPKASPAQIAEIRQGQEVLIQEREPSGHGFLYTYLSPNLGGSRPGAIEMAYSLDGLDRFRHNAIIGAGVVSILLLAGSGFVIALLGVTVVGNPLERLIEKTRRVGTGDLSGPLDISSHDELSELAAALNVMCDQLAAARDQVHTETEARIAALEQLRHAERLTTVGRLAAGMAHELGTPMNVASVRAELIIEEAPSEDAVASARIIKNQVDKMAVIIRQLLDFARRRTPRKERTELSLLTQVTTQLLDGLAKSKHVEIEFASSPEELPAMADAGQLQQVLSNLLVNAVQAMPNGGTIKVATSRGNYRPRSVGADVAGWGDYARIDVRDEGVGIPPDNLHHIFDPFFTTKGVGEGTGLGLSIAYGIVEDHGGWIDVASVVGQGSCFSVFVPLINEPAERMSPAQPATVPNTVA